MRTTPTVKLFFNNDYVAAEQLFDTTRTSGWIVDSLAIPGLRLTSPQAATREQLLDVHSAEYVDAVISGEPESLARSQGFPWEPRLFSAVAASTGGVIADRRDYLQTIERELDRLGHAGFCLVLYNAGVDPAGDGVSQHDLVTREEIVFEWIDRQESPAAFVLAGGYVDDGLTRNELVALHVATITKAHEIRARRQAAKQRHSNRWRLGEEEVRR